MTDAIPDVVISLRDARWDAATDAMSPVDLDGGALADAKLDAQGDASSEPTCRFPVLDIEHLDLSSAPHLEHSFLDMGETMRQLAAALDALVASNDPSCLTTSSDGTIEVNGCENIRGTFRPLQPQVAPQDGGTSSAYSVNVVYGWKHETFLPYAAHSEFLVHIVGQFGFSAVYTPVFNAPGDIAFYDYDIRVFALAPGGALRFSDPAGTLAFSASDFSFLTHFDYWDRHSRNTLLYTDEMSRKTLVVEARHGLYYQDAYGGGMIWWNSLPSLSFQDGTTRLFTSVDVTYLPEISVTVGLENDGTTEYAPYSAYPTNPFPACASNCTDAGTQTEACGNDAGAHSVECIYGNWRTTSVCGFPQ